MARSLRPSGRINSRTGASGWLLVFLAVLAVAASASLAATTASTPRCFGAASRDPYRPCHNPALDHVVIPSVAEAEITPSWPCTETDPTINLCLFGDPAGPGVTPVALVGDSHAGHWRAALSVVASDLQWEGLSITLASCTFSEGINVLGGQKGAICRNWVQAVLAWLRAHPSVHLMFMSDHRGEVKAAPGQSELAAQIMGYKRVLLALPRSIQHVVIIRDDPYIHYDTLNCVQQAQQAGEIPAQACKVPRSWALQPDPEVLAAEQLDSPRYRVIDESNVFCSRRWCYPVIGGVLVYADDTHISREFSLTMGPLLQHAIGYLLAQWYPR